jgi:hypothetical protein
MKRWQFVLHQQALEEIVSRPNLRVRILPRIVRQSQKQGANITPLRRPQTIDRAYFVKNLQALRVIYWLDAFAREVCVVRVERF